LFAVTWGLYSGFLVIAALLCVAPGPDTLVVLKNAMSGGRRGGLLATFGVFVGNLTMGTVVALGVGALIMKFQPAFVALHWLGAGYLLYLGVVALRAARRGDYAAVADARAMSGNGWRRWSEGLLSNVTNPKVLVVYLSVLPQFLTPHTTVPEALLLAWTIGGLGLVWQGALVLVVHRARGWFGRRRVRRTIDGVLGAVLIGFSAALVLDS
jgi:threonine/homoserine/homoserine lactone efflux protein